MAWNTATATINEPQGVSVEILSSLQNSSKVAYINASYWLNGEVEPPSMTTIRDNVLKLERRYLIDFTAIEDPSQKEEAKSFSVIKLDYHLLAIFWLLHHTKESYSILR